ncbi:MAG: lytic transglycosylase domain-containing protein [Persicimonas sp.]
MQDHTTTTHLKGLLAAGVTAFVCALLIGPADARADLYKYKKPSGEIIITTEKRSGYELIEVIEGGSGGNEAKRSASGESSGSSSSKSASNSKADKAPAQPPSELTEKDYGEDDFDDIIEEASEAYDVPFGFIKAVIRVESNFQPGAVSGAGAQGLMQLMPRTAESLNVTDPFDVRQNIFGGARFLRVLIDRYEGDINLILAAYNAGDVAVTRYKGIPYPKTRDYVASVFHWYKIYEDDREEQ